MPDCVRIGIVGLGFGAHVHGPAFESIEGCRVVALAGQTREKAKAIAAKFADAKGFSNWREMFDSVKLDAISIAVPPVYQPEIAYEAAERGISIFCEKPLAIDLESAEKMLAAVTANKVVHAINLLFPEIPAWDAVKRCVDEMIADQSLKRAALTWHVETYANRHLLTNSWKVSAAEGGGALNSFVSHAAYYLEWLFGPADRLLARISPQEGAIESSVEAWIEFVSGISVSMSVALDCPFGSGHRLEIYGKDSAIILDNQTDDYVNGFNLKQFSRKAPAIAPDGNWTIPTAADGRVWATSRIAERFVDGMRSGVSPTPNLANGVRAQLLLQAFRLSHKNQSWTTVHNGKS